MNKEILEYIESLEDNELKNKAADTVGKLKQQDISAIRAVYGVYSNTDLTEGRGRENLIRLAETKTTAIRLAKKKGVMGSNGHVRPVVLFKILNTWYKPTSTGDSFYDVERPTEADVHAENKRLAHQRAIEAAKAAGLSDEHIKALSGGDV